MFDLTHPPSSRTWWSLAEWLHGLTGTSGIQIHGGSPIAGWFTMETPVKIKMHDLEVPRFFGHHLPSGLVDSYAIDSYCK